MSSATAAMRRGKVAAMPSDDRLGSLPSDQHLDGVGLKLDVHAVSSAISNGDDIAPLLRRAFASGRPEALLQSLRHFSRMKEKEIEDVCKVHYQDFIRAVDDLRSLLSDVDSLKSSLSDANSLLHSVGEPLLLSLVSYLDALSQSRNLSLALSSSLLCVRLLDLCSRANSHLSSDNIYMALRCIDSVERDGFLDSVPSPSLRRMLESTIPAIRAYAERRISRDFSDWLVRIRVVSRSLGQLAISRASAARQRDEELRARQRLAEEQSRRSSSSSSSSDPPIYTLHLEEDDDIAASNSGQLEGGPLDLTPLFRAFHIHQTLGLEDRFRKYYYENRKLQLTSDFQVSTMTPFLESHQAFFAQIAGFFIVEDRVLRTGGGSLISRLEVDSLWEIAVSKMVSVLEDQFSRMNTANHLLLVKDYVGLLAVTLRRYGYAVDTLVDVLGRHADKYHELLMIDCRKQISEALAADELTRMRMHHEYEYNMHVLSFQLQTSDIAPAYAFQAPFSASVPDCCRIVRSFIEDSVSFLSHGGQLDFYSAVSKHLDKLLSDVLDAALLSLVESSIRGITQATQVAANMVVFERACDFFYRHAAHLSGMPPRMVDRIRRDFPLARARDATEGLLLALLRVKIDESMILMEEVNWVPDISPSKGNRYADEIFLYLEDWVSVSRRILPTKVLSGVLQGILVNISDKIIGMFMSESIRRFNDNAVTAIDNDLKIFESFIEAFIEKQSSLFPEDEPSEAVANELRASLLEVRQLVNLLMSNNPENFLNPVIRQRHYSKLDYKKVLAILEKFKDSNDSLFGTFGRTAARQNPKKKSLDALIRRLKDAT